MTDQGTDDGLARDVHVLLQKGQFEDTGARLDQLFAFEETTVERSAAYHFTRAELCTLLFRPREELPHYAQAYRPHPTPLQYAQHYALALQQQHRATDAEPLYQTSLALARAALGQHRELYAILTSDDALRTQVQKLLIYLGRAQGQCAETESHA